MRCTGLTVTRALTLLVAGAVVACGGNGGADTDTDAGADATTDAGPDAAGCPADMVPVGAACIDRYEAPNRAGELPLVMFTFDRVRFYEIGFRCCRDR